jgi:hypothetical protein
MKIRYIAPVAMVATGGSDRVSTARGSRVHYHRHRRGDSGPVAGQRADHHSAWGCGAAVRRAAIPVLRIRQRVAVPPRRPPLTAVPFERSGGKPPHPPLAHTGLWPNLPVGGGARSAAVRRIALAIFGNRFRCRHRESMWRLALRGRRQGFCRGRIRRRNGCPVPPIYRRGDARGARSVSGRSAADLGSAPDAVTSARERLGEGVYRCHCACGVIAAPPVSRSRRQGPEGEPACLSAVSTVKHQGDFGPRERPHDRPD